MQCEGECSGRSQWRRRGGEPASVSLYVFFFSMCVCPTGSRRCQTEEVSDGGEAEKVSVKEVSVMERGSGAQR